jgi:hypothetical protein
MAAGERPEAHLGAEATAALEGVGPAEVLVGVHALNQARSVLRVVEAVAAGLAKDLAPRTAAVLVADAGSRDGTGEAVQRWMETAPPDPPVRCVRLGGTPSRGRAILALLAAARRLQVSACGLVDAGLIGLAPEGVERLVRPVLVDEADYVSPAYAHGAAEGTLTTNLLAPLARALYGKRIQQVVGGCAGLRRGLVDRLLEADPLEGDLGGQEVELWVATEALASQARVVEASQGQKIMDPGLAPPDLTTTLVHTLGPFFRLMERYSGVWSEVRGSVALPRSGDTLAVAPGVGGARTDRMVHAFRLGLKDLLPVWEQILLEDTLARLYPLGLLAPDEFRFPPGLWARVVSDFAVAFHERRLARDHLLRALTPLYLGRVAAFLLEVQAGAPAGIPEALETIGRVFEAEKERLEARWR